MNKSILTILACLFVFLFSCTYTQKIRDGKTAFDRKQYAVASKMLIKEHDKAKSRVEKGKLAFLIGESYRKMNESEKAIPWYKKAYDTRGDVDALREYAFALKRNEEYEEAIKAFKNLGIEIGSPYEYRREITACTQAIVWNGKAKSKEYLVSIVDFNSGNADYSPVSFQKDQLIFTSDRGTSKGDEAYKWTGNKFSDLYLVNLQSNDVQPFNNDINTSNNEGTVTFNSDFTELYFTRCFSEEKYEDSFCKIMMSKKEGDSWTVPVVLNIVEEKVNYGHPSLSDDGNTLYFSCNHPDGWGGYDIYFSKRSEEGWTYPKMLSRSINTIGNEKFPFIDKDTLYFSSDYHAGMGGLDIFKTYKMDENNWSPAHNLKPPINSGADDFGLMIDRFASKKKDVLKVGYFSSSRNTGMGNDDIYRFEKVPPPPPPPIDTTAEPEPIVYKMILDVYILEKIYKIPDNPNSPVLGRKPLNEAKVSVRFGKEKKEYIVDEDGLVSMELDEKTDYNFFANKDGYLNNSEKFSTKGIGKDPDNPVLKFEVEIVLDKIYKNKEITLENIYYDFEKWNIRLDAQPTLNELASLLRQNPEIKIQLSSHTDCRGKTGYNQDLSQKRAQSAVNYLITQGIEATRLTAKGYGENALAIECVCARCSEDEHQANRRTTFKIVE